MEARTYRAPTNRNLNPFPRPPRVPRALPRSGTPLTLRYQKKHAESVQGRGTLSHWSAKGGRLEAEHPLEIGDWVELDIRRSRRETRPRQASLARVVSSASAPAAGYSYGVQFTGGLRTRIGYALYALAPWAALVLFVLGTINVVFLKTGNAFFFWYSPLTNLYSILISSYILSRFALSQFYSPPRDRGYRPSVSVVIACKNEEESIGRTIDCVYQSDYPREKLEVIAVNDGSTDGTLEEMRRAEARHPNLTVIDFGKNLGKRHGMAAGAKAATLPAPARKSCWTPISPSSTGCRRKSSSRRSGQLEVTNCDLKIRAWWSALCFLRVHRARGSHALERSAEWPRHSGEYRDRARFRATAAAARVTRRSCQKARSRGEEVRRAVQGRLRRHP